jgi:hypothetical protein
MARTLAIEPAARFPSMIGCIEALTLALSPATPPPRRNKRTADLAVGAAGLAFCAAALVATMHAASSTEVAPKPEVAAGAAEATASTTCPTEPEARQDDARVEQVVFPPAHPTREARVSRTAARAVSYRPDPY